MAKISIIGSGYTGSLIGKWFSKFGHKVIFCDVNKNTVENLTKEGYDSTQYIKRAVEETDISFICVPTPTANGKIDLSYIKTVSEELGKEIKNKSEYHLVVVKSTVAPKTTEDFVKPIIEKFSGKKCGEDFGLCANPEFLTQVNKTTKDLELQKWYKDNPNAIKTFEEKAVIGEYDKKSGDILEELFKNTDIPIFRTDLKTSEMIKYVHNLNLASRISYWNEIFLICNELSIDSKKVAEIVSTDSRIGKYGTLHGKAFGGTCLPKDLEAFVSFCKSHNIDPKLLEAVQSINKEMVEKHGIRE